MKRNSRKSYKSIQQIFIASLLIPFIACKETGTINQLAEVISSDFKIEEIGSSGFVGKSGSEYSFTEEKDSVMVTKKTLFVTSEVLKQKISKEVYSNIKDEILCLSTHHSDYISQKYSIEKFGRSDYKIENSNTVIELSIMGPNSCKLHKIFMENRLQQKLSSN